MVVLIVRTCTVWIIETKVVLCRGMLPHSIFVSEVNGFNVAPNSKFRASAMLFIRSAGNIKCRSQWPLGLKRRSAAARLLRSWVRIPPGAWMFVCCECCVLSGRGLCDELFTRPEESYRMWCVVVCELENLKNEEAMTRVGSQRHIKKHLLGVNQ